MPIVASVTNGETLRGCDLTWEKLEKGSKRLGPEVSKKGKKGDTETNNRISDPPDSVSI